MQAWAPGRSRSQPAVQPIRCFVQFLEAIAKLGDKLRFASRPVGFAIVRTDGRSGTQYLLPQDLGFRAFRQRGIYRNNAQRKLLRPLRQITRLRRVFIIHPPPFIITRNPINSKSSSPLMVFTNAVVLPSEKRLLNKIHCPESGFFQNRCVMPLLSF